MTIQRKSILKPTVGAIDICLGIGVVGLVAFSTAAFGTVKPWSELIAFQIGACLAGLLALRLLLAGGLPKTSAYLPILAFLAIVLFQMVDLPDGLLQAISPRTFADKTQLLSDIPGSAERLGHMTLSYYLYSGYHDLRVILLDTIVFLTILAIARSPRRVMALLIGFSVVAAGLAGLALAQDIAKAPNILWINGADTLTKSGPFLNHSDFSQQMNHLCGWVLALILVLAGAAWPKNTARRAWRIAGISLLAVVFIAGVVATLISQSRGGVTCIVVSSLIVVLGLAARRSLRSLVWLLVVVACVGLGAALLAGFDSIYARMLTVQHTSEYASRLANVKDIVNISKEYPLLGTGLGTHEVFFPRYETFAGGSLSTQAEVEYAQVIEETGYIGLSCVVLFVGIIWVFWKRAVSTLAEPITIAAVGLGYGLMAIEVQSLSDFGQHLPSLGCLTAVTCAMLITLGQMRDEQTFPRQLSPSAWASTFIGRAILAGIVLFAAGWAVTTAGRTKRADDLYTNASSLESFIESDSWARTPRQNRDVQSDLQGAIQLEPGNIEYHLWLGVDRWMSLTTPYGSGSPEIPPTISPGDPSPDANPALFQPVAEALNDARFHCPTYGPLLTFVGQIEHDILHEPIGARHIRMGAELAPHNVESLVAAARLDADQGLWESAKRLYQRMLIINPNYAEEIILDYTDWLHRPDLALQLAPDDYLFLKLLDSKTADPRIKKQATARVRELLIAACDGANPTGDELASLAMMRETEGDLAAAADLYRRAIGQDYKNVDWHLGRARLLLQLHDRAAAQAEASICLQLQPDCQPAQDLLNAISAPQSQ